MSSKKVPIGRIRYIALDIIIDHGKKIENIAGDYIYVIKLLDAHMEQKTS